MLLRSLRPPPWGAGSGATPPLCQLLTVQLPAAGERRIRRKSINLLFLAHNVAARHGHILCKTQRVPGGWSSPCCCVNPILREGSGAGWAPSCTLLASALQLEELGDVCPQSWGPSVLGWVWVRSCRAGSGAVEGQVCTLGAWGGCSALAVSGEGGLQPHTSASRCACSDILKPSWGSGRTDNKGRTANSIYGREASLLAG